MTTRPSQVRWTPWTQLLFFNSKLWNFSWEAISSHHIKMLFSDSLYHIALNEQYKATYFSNFKIIEQQSPNRKKILYSYNIGSMEALSTASTFKRRLNVCARLPKCVTVYTEVVFISSTRCIVTTVSYCAIWRSIACVFLCIQVTLGAINTMRLRLDEINCRKLMFIGLGCPVNPSFALDRETRLKSS